MMRATTQPPVVAKNTAKFASNLASLLFYGSLYTASGNEDFLTSKGRVPGATGVMTSTPLLSGIRNITQMVNNEMNPDLLFTYGNTARTK